MKDTSRDKKWSTAKSAAKGFIDNLYESKDGIDSDNRIAIVDFDDIGRAYPTKNNSSLTFLGVNNRITANGNNYSATNYFKNYVLDKAMSASGGTDYDEALKKAQEIINNRADSSRPVYIVL